MLNMSDYVTPNHFTPNDFATFTPLSIEEEFNLIAPVLIYFEADLKYREQAKAALKQLKKLQHPLLDDTSISTMLNQNFTPAGLGNRYNALMIAMVNEICPDAVPYIDEYGAFAFKIEDDHTAIMGDASNYFGFYMDVESVKKRINLFLH